MVGGDGKLRQDRARIGKKKHEPGNNQLGAMPCARKRAGEGQRRGVFRGTRVPVSAILKNLKNLSVNEVVDEYPSVTREQIQTVLDFIASSADPVLPCP